MRSTILMSQLHYRTAHLLVPMIRMESEKKAFKLRSTVEKFELNRVK